MKGMIRIKRGTGFEEGFRNTKLVWHQILRPLVGESLSQAQWRRGCDDYLQCMGFTAAHPRLCVLHGDAQGQHVHLVACRVRATGSV